MSSNTSKAVQPTHAHASTKKENRKRKENSNNNTNKEENTTDHKHALDTNMQNTK
jgi:hypothetical protein